MRDTRHGCTTLLVLVVVLAGFGFLLLQNARVMPSAPLAAALPTQAPPTRPPSSIGDLLREGFGDSSTPLPTIAIPTQALSVPTMAATATAALAEPLAAADVSGQQPDPVAAGATPTPALVVTAADDAAAVEVVSVQTTLDPSQWNPPPLLPPISRDPLGRDHFYLLRPVESNARNVVNASYPYGSDGFETANRARVHHGVDMSNPVGERVRAAGSGVVIWAADGRQDETDIFENSPSYGNVVVIEHDFGYKGQPIWTLYAHLSAAFVRPGDRVSAGQVIGNVGNTGLVTGPHVHFEVRVGENRYGSTFNPVLWMVPYVGHGIIAGRVIDANGNFVDDADITIRSQATRLTTATTTTYVFPGTASDVNPDPTWRENFAVPDVPAGRYDVITTINEQRVVRQVTVIEGTTAFVELRPVTAASDSTTPTAP